MASSAAQTQPRITDRELSFRREMMENFPAYAEKCLYIRPKSGSGAPFKLNRAQQYLHEKLEALRKQYGKVRALILKGRQQGASTYIEGRFYWRVTHRKGIRAFILTHEEKATQNLYEMAARFHEHCPDLMRPHTGAANAKELYFDVLDSGYSVGTAGTKAVGRSSTIQYFHGSEVAYWPFADEHAAGILQAVPDDGDTEVIMESTANGIGNYFHSAWQRAEAGQSQFHAIFLPWWWQDEYQASTDGFTPSPDELEYQAHAPDEITDGHLAWRRNKIAEIGEVLFKREYPQTPAEAFETSGEDVFIPPAVVMRARRGVVSGAGYPLICGVDPAYKGKDRTVFAFRRGRRAYASMQFVGKDNMEVAGLAVQLLQHGVWLPDASEPVKINRMFIDLGGMPGIVDRLRELGYTRFVQGVDFGANALHPERFTNRRAEMWSEMRDWLREQPCQVDDSDILHADLTQVLYDFDSSGRLKLEPKEKMRKRGVRSPDYGDALALTFAAPVSIDTLQYKPIQPQPTVDGFPF